MNAMGVAEQVARETRGIIARTGRTGCEVARGCGMSQSTLSRRLSGSSPFKIDELAAVAALLGVRVSSFFAQPPRRASNGSGSGVRVPRTSASTPKAVRRAGAATVRPASTRTAAVAGATAARTARTASMTTTGRRSA